MNIVDIQEPEASEESVMRTALDTLQSRVFDAIVIGGGVAGISAAISVASDGWNVLLLQGTQNGFEDYPGGLVALSEEVENYPGFGGARGIDLICDLHLQARRAGAVTLRENAMQAIFDSEGESHEVIASDGNSYFAPQVIIATGTRPRKLGVKGESELWGRGVSHYAALDGEFFRGEDVIIVGAGGTAYENARILNKCAKRVTVMFRSESHLAESRIASIPGIRLIPQSDLLSINGVSTVDSVTITTPEGPRDLHARGVFISIGHDPHFGFSHNLDMDQLLDVSDFYAPYLVVAGIPGIFVAGSLSSPTSSLAIVAAASGATAGKSASRQLEYKVDRS